MLIINTYVATHSKLFGEVYNKMWPPAPAYSLSTWQRCLVSRSRSLAHALTLSIFTQVGKRLDTKGLIKNPKWI